MKTNLILIFSLFFSANALCLTELETKIVNDVNQSAPKAEALLEKTVNINSGTSNIEGIRHIGLIFKKEFDALGFTTRWVKMPESMKRAGHFFAELGNDKQNRVLMIGHLDTVFDKTSPFQKFKREGDLASGPGASDMKGGIVAIIYALKALKTEGLLSNMNITIALLGDEEDVGSPRDISRKDLIEAAKNCEYALAFEGAGKEMQEATISRRGISRWTLDITGHQGHSSKIFSNDIGYGTSFEAARILSEFNDKLKSFEYLTFNPGLVLSGTDVQYDPIAGKGIVLGKMNIVAPQAKVIGDVRFISDSQLEKVKEKMKEIISKNLPQTSATISFEDMYPAMAPTEENRKLLNTLSQVNEELGYGKVKEEHPLQRGAGDVSFVANNVKAALDGLGVLGQKEHSPDEIVDLRSLPKTASRTAILLYRLQKK